MSHPTVWRRTLVLALLLAPRLSTAVEFPVEKRVLANGLTVLLAPDHSAPVISSYIFYRSGSRNEVRGQTGIAHLFEHMMFNGGKKFGPGVFDDMIEGNGGSTNGYTTHDFTAYLNNFPREALPVVLDLESDRMWHLAITKQNLEQERGIVSEERRLRIDNDVGGSMNEALYFHAFVQSGYRWNTIGFMSDIQRITLEEARAYFTTYYAPNNAIVVLAGDLEPAPTFALVERYFGKIPRHPAPRPVDPSEPPQEGERRAEVHKQAELPAVLIGYHAVDALHPDRPAIDVAARIMSEGEASRFHQDLVREHEIATGVEADLDWSIQSDLFGIYAQARPNHTAKELEARIDAVVAKMAAEPVTADELAKAKRQLRAQAIAGLKTVGGKANKLGFAEIVLGGYRDLFGLEEQWDAVTADDVRRVVGTYLVPSQRTVVTLIPTSGGSDKK